MKEIQSQLLHIAQAPGIKEEELIQSLWSGYGSLVRVRFHTHHPASNKSLHSVIVKHIHFNKVVSHPRGWSSDMGHRRKIRSYEVEQSWYEYYANQLPAQIKVPRCYEVIKRSDSVYLVMEDLGSVGYPILSGSVNPNTVQTCIEWLARFHAFHLNVKPIHLWERGSYWHLKTRPDELEKLFTEDPDLAEVADCIDERLRNSPFQTLIHGDAKMANFCFSVDGYKTAAVDFQYVGEGIGMQDLAYFIGSCLSESECADQESQILNSYFLELRQAANPSKFSTSTLDEMEISWRKLYPYAWADFQRFLKGWSPGHWKVNGYSQRLCKSVIAQIKNPSHDREKRLNRKTH